VGEMINAYRFDSENLKETGYLVDVGVDGRIILKLFLT
jgi:hypothetical protein